jgi:amino acid transporter
MTTVTIAEPLASAPTTAPDPVSAPAASAVLAMSAHGAIPRWFARMHLRFRTPTVATLVMGVISALFYVLLTGASKNVLADSAASAGLLIAFYYGLTLPGAFVLSIKSYWPAASSYSSFHGIGGIFLIGAGSLAVGVVLMVVTARFLPRYFKDGITAPMQGEGSSHS